MIRVLTLLGIVLAGSAVGQESASQDPPGNVRYDAEGNAQMWGGPSLPEITANDQFDRVLAESKERPVLIFKHSTQCPISARAAARVDAWVKAAGEKAPRVYWLKVIESREVSNKVESRLGVKHESPQIVLVVAGEAAWDTSHDAITAEAIVEGLAAAEAL